MTKSVFVPEHLFEKIALLPEHRLGVHRVTVKLRNGKTFFPVLVAWETEIVRVEDSEHIPFNEIDILDLDVGPCAYQPSGPQPWHHD